MIGPAGVRLATRSDRSAVTATVAQAFAYDQAWRSLLGADYLALYAAVKEGEYAKFMGETFAREYAWYL